MTIKAACACGKKLAVKDEDAGKRMRCPACQKLDDEWDSDEKGTARKSSGANRGLAIGLSAGGVCVVVLLTWVLWPNADQSTLTLKGHTDMVISVAFSQDGQRLGSGSVDGTVKVWDAATGQESLTLKGHTKFFGSVAFGQDSKRLTLASADGVKVWDATTGKELLTLKGHTGQVNSAVFSQDGTRLASASSDETVKVWDATTG